MKKFSTSNILVAALIAAVLGGGFLAINKVAEYDEKLRGIAVDLHNVTGYLDEFADVVDSINTANAAEIEALKKKVAKLENGDDDDDKRSR